MKNNTKRTKELLQKTIQSLPVDFALNEVRFHLRQALYKINKTEAKRHKRNEIQTPPIGLAPFAGELNSSKAIDVIDGMIQEEKDKLDSFKNLNDQTLFG
jgi:hypothetical protein